MQGKSWQGTLNSSHNIGKRDLFVPVPGGESKQRSVTTPVVAVSYPEHS